METQWKVVYVENNIIRTVILLANTLQDLYSIHLNGYGQYMSYPVIAVSVVLT